EERDAGLARVAQQLAVRIGTELEGLPMLAVRSSEAELVVVRMVVEVASVLRSVGALLQLDGIDTALLRDVDQALRKLDVALMVVADFRDDVARTVVADLPAVDRESAPAHDRPMLVARCCERRRSTSASTSICTSC